LAIFLIDLLPHSFAHVLLYRYTLGHHTYMARYI
jgi:hypothetical protein